jgi:hypothetical protein
MTTNEYHLDYFLTPVSCPVLGQRYVTIAFGTDGTMWIEPAEVGIGPEHTQQLARYPGKALLFDKRHDRFLINARAVVEVNTDPEFRKQWLGYVERMLQEHQDVRASVRHECFRRN